MQTRHFKRLLPLTAVALLITAFLAIELDEMPGPCERKTVSGREEGNEQLARPQSEYFKYKEAISRANQIAKEYEDLFQSQFNLWNAFPSFLEDGNGDITIVPDGKGGCKKVVAITILVIEETDQKILPPEHSLPGMLEGFPVQVKATRSGTAFQVDPDLIMPIFNEPEVDSE